MPINLPRIIQRYIDASNAHDIESILECFADGAVVRDEHETLRGKKAIEGWIVKTIEKYKFQFRPLSAQESEGKVVARVEISGTFRGSPVTLDYYFAVANDKIASLKIDS